MSASDPYLSVGEVAEELNVSVESVRDWIAQGRLAAIRPGRRAWRVRRSDLQRMLDTADSSIPKAPPADAASRGQWRRSPYDEHVTRAEDQT